MSTGRAGLSPINASWFWGVLTTLDTAGDQISFDAYMIMRAGAYALMRGWACPKMVQRLLVTPDCNWNRLHRSTRVAMVVVVDTRSQSADAQCPSHTGQVSHVNSATQACCSVSFLGGAVPLKLSVSPWSKHVEPWNTGQCLQILNGPTQYSL